MLIKTQKLLVSKHKRAIAIIIGLMALLWFLALSELLLVKPGSIMTMRQNILFHSDTSLSIHLLTDETFSAQPSFQYFVHSLEFFLWRPVCRTLYHLLGIFLPIDYSRVFAGRLLVATIAGIGVGSLALFAFSNGVKLVQCVLLFIMYMMFTANTIVALPEHFGLSNGLLSVAFVVPLIAQDTRLNTAWGPVGQSVGRPSLLHFIFSKILSHVAQADPELAKEHRPVLNSQVLGL